MKRFALLCMLAGCFSDEAGLHIVVRDKTGRAVSVDMYLGVDEPAGISGMKPKAANAPMAGRVVTLDSADPPKNGPLTDGEVVFNILPKESGEPLDLPTVVFIGRDRQNQPVSFGHMDRLSLKAGGSVAYIFDLEQEAVPVAEPSDDPQPVGTRIFEWNDHDGDRVKCVDVEITDGAPDATAHHFFLVPPDDPDCDGVTECTPDDEYVYGPLVPVSPPPPAASLDNVSCARKYMAGGETLCKLGAKTANTCDPADMDVCTPFTEQEKFCAPLSVCASSSCFDDPDTCFKAAPPSIPVAGTFLDCVIPVTETGATCMGLNASSAPAVLGAAFSAQFNLGNPPPCLTTRVWHPGRDLADTASSNTFVQSGTGVDLSFSAVDDASHACAFTLLYGGGAQSLAYATGGIDVALEGGGHLVLPVRVSFIGCTEGAGSCSLVRDEADKESFKDCLP